MKTVIDLDDDLLERARQELGTKSKKDTIHAALRLVAERGARLAAVRELMSIDRDWSGIVDDDKTLGGRQVLARPPGSPARPVGPVSGVAERHPEARRSPASANVKHV